MYDAIFGDDQGTQWRYEFIKEHMTGNSVIEVACGSGDLLSLLAQENKVTGIDIDEGMISLAQQKYPHLKNNVKVGNFLTFNQGHYDTLVCFGDSLNYLSNEKELEKFVENSITLANTIIIDMHHPYRLIEFKEGYEEEGVLPDLEYAYLLESKDDYLIHIINYLDGTFDSVHQWVFNPKILIEMYENKGCNVDVFTDFELGYPNIGEKVMLVITVGDNKA